MTRPSKVFAIDPSKNDVGWAHWQRDGEDMEWRWGVYHLDGWNFLQRCKDLVHRVHEEGLEFEHLLIEWPMFYSSDRGQIAAAEGYTINLAGVGMYLAGWTRLDVECIQLITAPQWKGNASKDVTARRFFKQFGVNPLHEDHNAIDAVMMLLATAQKQGWLMPD